MNVNNETKASSQKWGRGQIVASNKRRRITAEPTTHGWDGDFKDNGLDNAGEEEGWNPFDSIDRLLDQREHEAQLTESERDDGHAPIVDQPTHEYDHPLTIQRDDNDDHFSCHASYFGVEANAQSNAPVGDIQMTDMNSDPAVKQHQVGTVIEQNQKVTGTTANKRTTQYSVFKSSTPRFTFQSTVKTAPFQTPQQSLNRNLFSTQTSTKFKRHSFRKSLDTAPIVKDVKSLECTPSFLPTGRRTKEGISQESPHNAEGIPEGPSSSFASLKSTLVNDGQRQSTASRSGKCGYLIQRVRSLHNNDQRMAMRLRSGLYSNNSMMRKRRRSSNDFLDPKHSAKTELDVTVSDISSAFGDSKSMLVGYIHRYESANSGTSIDGMKLNLPCFAWILLSNDVVREQGITKGATKQLRFYDAVVIPKRFPRDSKSVPMELAMPTIACSNVCEQYSAETALLEISFDHFIRYA